MRKAKAQDTLDGSGTDGTKKRRGIFYGWWIVLGAFMTNLVNTGSSGYALTVMIVPMQDAFGVGRSVLALAPTIRSASSALLSPFIGPLMDKPGRARIIMTLGALSGSLSLVLTGLSPTVVVFLLSYGVLGGLSMLATGNMLGSVLMSKWFVRKRARATALASQGIALGGVVMAPIIAFSEDGIGWRSTWVLLGIMSIAILLPIALLIVKTEPEELGLKPDGDVSPQPQANVVRPPAAEEIQWTRGQAVRTPAFWLLTFTLGLTMSACMGVMLHIVPFLQEEGLSKGMASWAVTVFSLGSNCAYLTWGYMLDKFPARVMLVGAAILAGVGISMMMYAGAVSVIFMGAFLYGFGFGSGPISRMVWANYYGRKLQGSIQGIVMPFSMGFNMIGPLMGGILYDLMGDYLVAFNLYILMTAVAAFLGLLTLPPRKRQVLSQTAPQL